LTLTVATYEGRCHCGALGFEFSTGIPPAEWAVRACQCAFCRAHAAACTADPSGSVTFRHATEAMLHRYRFGLHTADFLLCRNCGVYLGAVLTTARQSFATLNTRAMPSLPLSMPCPQPITYGHESVESRVQRRQSRWTPVAEYARASIP
jgi:hypothetical protein